jgi:YcaO-like protein with predicted kinase domain
VVGVCNKTDFAGSIIWKLEPALKLTPTLARAASLAETDEMLRPVLAKVPVTRVSDLTPLDRLGLPVYSAVTPLARDLTIHMGKGLSKESARISALMEAVERVSAEDLRDQRVVQGTFRNLHASNDIEVVDPHLFDLPSDSEFQKSEDYHWVASYDLLNDQEIWMPADLVVSPASEGILLNIDTNGIASGNTLLEAVNHALCEVIERDAVSQLEFTSFYGENESPRLLRSVELSTLPEIPRLLCRQIQDSGLEIVLHLIESDVDIPTFRAMIIDTEFPSSTDFTILLSPGFGTNPNAEVGVTRAVSEAFQSRVGYIQGARDSFNVLPLSTISSRKSLLSEISPTSKMSFTTVPSVSNMQFLDDLDYLIAQLRKTGMKHVVVTDLTRKNFGVPVVRVRVSGLSGYAVNRRRSGWRCLRHLI